MPISDTVLFILVPALALVFSIFALTIEENRILLKLLAGLCWMIFAFTPWILISPPNFWVYIYSMVGFLFMFVFWFSTVSDWFKQKKDKIWSFET